MLISMETYLRQGQRHLRRWAVDPRIQSGARVLGYAASGFFLSAAGLSNAPQPLAMGLICAVGGWRAAVTTLGAMVGYRVFWGAGGWLGTAWAAAAGVLALLWGTSRLLQDMPALLPAASALAVSSIGLSFLFFLGSPIPMGVYFLQVALAAVSAWLFPWMVRHRDAAAFWMAGGIATLALARVCPVPYLGFGYIAAGMIAVGGAFPGAALAGLGLDLARVTPVPMAAVVCIAYFLRLLPVQEKWLRYAAPGLACVTVLALCGIGDLTPLPGLVLGGGLGYFLPPRPEGIHRRGETGVAQVRLELSAGVLAQAQQILLEAESPPIDELALLGRVRDRACQTCAARGSCRDQDRLKPEHLRHPLDFACRKSVRIQTELQRGLEQLRAMKADRQRLQDYRWALIQQYQFLSQYLQQLSDQLPRRGERLRAFYTLEVSARSLPREQANGDRCLAFPGSGCRYYILLCDGMGTGLGAAREGDCAGQLLRRMLTAGFPAEHALRSVNSLLALRGQAGAVTADLAEIRLDTGHVALYKWGAAPSWVLRKNGAEKIGTATPPPGLSVRAGRETVSRLSLRRGEALILVSDGVEVGEILRHEWLSPDAPPGELAEGILKKAGGSGEDDATVAVIRLCPRQPST